MNLEFSDEEMEEYLLNRGFVILDAVIEEDENIYQNVFKTSLKIIKKVYLEGEFHPIDKIFKRELIKQLLNQI